MKNFTAIPNEIFEESQLSVPARYLLCVLLKYCGQNEWCYPSQKTLGTKLGYSARYIRTLLTELILSGLIVKKRTGFNETNTYRVAKDFMVERKQSSFHLGSRNPFNQGAVLPPKNTYIKAKVKKNMEIMRDKLTKKGILKPSQIILKGG